MSESDGVGPYPRNYLPEDWIADVIRLLGMPPALSGIPTHDLIELRRLCQHVVVDCDAELMAMTVDLLDDRDEAPGTSIVDLRDDSQAPDARPPDEAPGP